MQAIRDKAAFSSRASGKGALLHESHAVFKAVAEGLALANVRQGVLGGKLIPEKMISTRRSIWMALRHRYFSVDPYVARSLADASRYNAESRQYRSLSYLYYALRDRTVFHLVTGPIWERWRSGSFSLEPSEFGSFVEGLSAEHPSIKHWRESTRIGLGRNIYAALRDFGVLVGRAQKSIQQPSVAAETLFHLLSILDAEGLRGCSLLAAPDWRLFLLSEMQVACYMKELVRYGWIRFEKSGAGIRVEIHRRMGDE